MDIGNLKAFLRDTDWQRRTCQLLSFMGMHGQSVTLNWGEDDNLWECSWITSGTRFTTLAKNYEDAIAQTARKVVTAAEHAAY